jgi:hypothetical protein
MTNHRFLLGTFLSFSALLLGSFAFAGQHGAPETGTPIQMLVTAHLRHGHSTETPNIHREDVQAREERDLRPVTNWIPAQWTHAGLQLLLLLDDSSRFVLGGQLDGLRKFINGQPPTTSIGIGYLHNGTVEMAQDFTVDHDAAAKSLRVPQGSTIGAASPYLSITDMLKHWPASPANPRREILLMSDGIDALGGGGALNPYVNEAIENVQRAGVPVYSIYTPGAERNGQRANVANWGKTYLSMISSQSGGESFYLGFGSAVSFAPFLDNLKRILDEQYLLTFLAKPQSKGGFQKVKVSTEIPNVQLTAADQVYVPAGAQ